jgi:hypothetical protein
MKTGRALRAPPCPAFRGAAIKLRFIDDPRAWRGRLVAGGERGRPVHAGSFPRKRLMVLDRALLDTPPEMARIVAHELFHFAWVRLGNAQRRGWERLLEVEIRSRAGGELGWSAEWRKRELRRPDPARRTRRWRQYACESFCDTAAWLLAGAARHTEFTLPAPARRARRRWFGVLLSRPVSI